MSVVFDNDFFSIMIPGVWRHGKIEGKGGKATSYSMVKELEEPLTFKRTIVLQLEVIFPTEVECTHMTGLA